MDDYPINLRRRKNRTIRPKSNIIIDASPEPLWTTAHPPPPLLAWGGVTTAGGGELEVGGLGPLRMGKASPGLDSPVRGGARGALRGCVLRSIRTFGWLYRHSVVQRDGDHE